MEIVGAAVPWIETSSVLFTPACFTELTVTLTLGGIRR